MKITVIGRGSVGGVLEKACMLRTTLRSSSPSTRPGSGPFFYRIAGPGEL